MKLISDNVWRRTNQKKVVLSSTLRTVGHASLLSRGHTRSARALLSPRNPRTSPRFTSHRSDVVDAREHDDDEYLRCALCAVRLMANADGGLVAPCGLARPNHAHAKLAKQTALRAAPSLSNSAPLSREGSTGQQRRATRRGTPRVLSGTVVMSSASTASRAGSGIARRRSHGSSSRVDEGGRASCVRNDFKNEGS